MPDPITTAALVGTGVLAVNASSNKDGAENESRGNRESPPALPPRVPSSPPTGNPTSFIPMPMSLVVERALSQLGQGTYKLGGGARFDGSISAFGPEGNQFPGFCDCSGFIAWCLRYRRGSYNTDAIVNDAKGAQKRYRLVRDDEPVRASDVIVKSGPDKNGDGVRDSPGHVGIITRVLSGFVRGMPQWWTKLEVTHCNGYHQNAIDPGTGKRHGAINQNDAKGWSTSGYIVRPLHVI